MTSAENQTAIVLGRYLIGVAPGDRAIELFVRAVARLPAPDARDQRLLSLILAHPSLTGIIDAGLALRAPESAVRRRMLIMLAVLESMPEHAPMFLPARPSKREHLDAAAHAIRAVLRAAAGATLLAFI